LNAGFEHEVSASSAAWNAAAVRVLLFPMAPFRKRLSRVTEDCPAYLTGGIGLKPRITAE
jgi:hypothetical protein